MNHVPATPARRVSIAVPSPLRRCFDYGWPEDAPTPAPGMRVSVPFGSSTRIGVVIGEADRSCLPASRLRQVHAVLDREPVLPRECVALVIWAADYYHHPIGEVVSSMLPAPLRRGRTVRLPCVRTWRVSEAGRGVGLDALARTPAQRALLLALRAEEAGVCETSLGVVSRGWKRAVEALRAKGWVEVFESAPSRAASPDGRGRSIELDTAQSEAVGAIASATGFEAFLLDGVTGSGKTEVYLSLIQQVIARGKQALVLVPEIGLTPQIVARFRDGLRCELGVIHSGLSDTERMEAWLRVKDGSVAVLIGTRSAVFTPMRAPGIFIVDEEHDVSYKQQEGFRYSARDVAVMRARQADVPVVLGTATPSLESFHNVRLGRYRHLRLPRRVSGAEQPAVRVLDVRGRTLEQGLSTELLDEIGANLARGEQTLLFLNRRGFAPVLMCHDCGWMAECARCDAHLVYHRVSERLCCHHCASERASDRVCPTCGSLELHVHGVGTQRVSAVLTARFPDARIARLDRDATKAKGALERLLGDVQARRTDILIGTQMLAKGHHFPHVTLASIIDADGGLVGADFRAGERMAQLLVQVAGRAGRGERAGRVIIQTHHPDHPLLRALISKGYEEFARAALEERKTAGLPPITALALVRAEAHRREPGFEFLKNACAAAQRFLGPGLGVLGPVPAPMERRAGRYRAQLLVEADTRPALHRFLTLWIPILDEMKPGRRVRWSLDVDPQDML